MSSFICEYCGTHIIDTDKGYITGCEHYPLPERKDMTETTFFKIPTITIKVDKPIKIYQKEIKTCLDCPNFHSYYKNISLPIRHKECLAKDKVIESIDEFPDFCPLPNKEEKK